MRARLVTATVLLVGLGALALPSSAATQVPQLTDAAGDSHAPMGGMDIVSGLWSTTGTTAKVGGKSVYTPKNLVVTIGYADAVTMNPGAAHEVRFTAPNTTYILDVFGTSSYAYDGDFNELPMTVAVAGKNLTLTLPLADMGLKPGAELSALRALTTAAEPVDGTSVPLFFEGSPLGTTPEAFASDNASTDKTYKIA